MSSASYIDDMLTETDLDSDEGLHEIANFYAGRNVLLTGGSGFLGKLLTEKILRVSLMKPREWVELNCCKGTPIRPMRTCSGIKTLFLLLRTKKGKTPEERFEELFKDVIFDRLRKAEPEFAQKVVLISADLVQADLGLSPENRELLRSAHIVIHTAATVRFDEAMKTAVNINVRATKELVLLAREMTNLKAFVHVSTAYSNCVSNVIDEKFYPPPFDSDKLLSLTDVLDDAALAHLTPVLLGKWPNTYAFTKAAAEDTIRRNGHGLPICVVRPSIIVATAREPVAGWINNVYGATGIVVGAAVGLLRTLHGDQNLIADLIPADYVVNNIIVAAWDIAKAQGESANRGDIPKVPEIKDPPIYNCVSSVQRPIKWGELMKHIEHDGMAVASEMCLWYYCFAMNRYRWVHNLYIIFLHLVPAAIVDSLAFLTGRKPMLWAAYKKIHKFSSVIEYFTLQEWQFHNTNVRELVKKLSPADRHDFNMDIETLDWREYSYQHVRGLRLYILKDPMETLPQGLAKYKRLKIIHYTLMTAICVFLLWLLWMALRCIGLF